MVLPANQVSAAGAAAAAGAVSGSLFHLDLCINAVPRLPYLSVVLSVSAVLAAAAEC